MNRCPTCDGKFKQVTKKHTIKTRHHEKNNIVIENLPVLQCSICGHIEIPEASENVIRAIRYSIRREMEEKANNSTKDIILTSTNEKPSEVKQYLQETKNYFEEFKKKVRNLIG